MLYDRSDELGPMLQQLAVSKCICLQASSVKRLPEAMPLPATSGRIPGNILKDFLTDQSGSISDERALLRTHLHAMHRPTGVCFGSP